MNYRYESLRTQKNSSQNELALAVLEGLSQKEKSLPSRLFYDDEGSIFFQKIMSLPEYYPTRCEMEILKTHREAIIDVISGDSVNMIELGSGDGQKTVVLLDTLADRKIDTTYVPIDISEQAIKTVLGKMEDRYKGSIGGHGLVAEYFEGLDWITTESEKKNVVLFLGSNIGNFSNPAAMRFLRQLWYSLNNGDYLLIGFDLKKDPHVLRQAYNDSQGITSAFNLNLLDRINRELDANFDRSKFTHQGHYSVRQGAMESYIISLEEQTVRVGALGKEFQFLPWEGVHVEYSNKYLFNEIEDFASSTGYEVLENFFDSKKYYVDSIWKVRKD